MLVRNVTQYVDCVPCDIQGPEDGRLGQEHKRNETKHTVPPTEDIMEQRV